LFASHSLIYVAWRSCRYSDGAVGRNSTSLTSPGCAADILEAVAAATSRSNCRWLQRWRKLLCHHLCCIHTAVNTAVFARSGRPRRANLQLANDSQRQENTASHHLETPLHHHSCREWKCSSPTTTRKENVAASSRCSHRASENKRRWVARARPRSRCAYVTYARTPVDPEAARLERCWPLVDLG
jgi:hypothetical protein